MISTAVVPALASLALMLSLGACQTVHQRPRIVPGLSGMAAVTEQRMTLREPRSPFPGLSLTLPEGMRQERGQGDDSITDSFDLGQAKLSLEYWVYDTAACLPTACQTEQANVGGRGVTIMRSQGQASRFGHDFTHYLQAFVPAFVSRGESPTRGVRFIANCTSQKACDSARAVLISLRFD